MHNKLTKSLLAILFMLLFTIGSSMALPESSNTTDLQLPPLESLDDSIDEALQNSTQEVKTPHVEDIKVMTPNANMEVKNNVLKDSDSSLKFTIKKFLCAMGGVLISSVILFLILTVMNKVNAIKHLGFPPKESDDTAIPPAQKEEIIMPGGENDALKIFFEKTR